jgi:predicted lipid carrier protein YhbT
MLKLKILPQPDMFLRPIPGFAQAQLLEHLINRIFAGHALTQLQPLAGRHLLFCTPGGELELMMHISEQRIHISQHKTTSPDVTIRGDLMALMALCLGLEDSDSLFFSRHLLMTGDTSVGLMFKNILTNLDFDLRVEMEQQLGKTMAESLWEMGYQAIRAVEYVDQQLADVTVSIGERLGLSSVEKVKSLQRELDRLNEENEMLKRRSERRLRPVRQVAS